MPSLPSEPSPQRLEEIFQQALDLDPGARTAWLAEACAGDEALYARALKLLGSADAVKQRPAWLAPAIASEALASVPATVPELGRYRLLSKLGAGGMGVVYRAERSDGAYQKEVAIKIVPWASGDERL